MATREIEKAFDKPVVGWLQVNDNVATLVFDGGASDREKAEELLTRLGIRHQKVRGTLALSGFRDCRVYSGGTEEDGLIVYSRKGFAKFGMNGRLSIGSTDVHLLNQIRAIFQRGIAV